MRRGRRRQEQGLAAMVAGVILAGILLVTVASYFFFVQQSVEQAQQQSEGRVQADQEQRSEKLEVEAALLGGFLMANVSDVGPESLQISYSLVLNATDGSLLESRDYTAAPPTLNPGTTQTLNTTYAYPGGATVLVKVVTMRGTAETATYPALEGNTMRILAFDAIVGQNVNVSLTVIGQANGTSYDGTQALFTGIEGITFVDVVGDLNVTAALADPFGQTFTRWADGFANRTRLLDLPGIYSALYGAGSTIRIIGFDQQFGQNANVSLTLIGQANGTSYDGSQTLYTGTQGITFVNVLGTLNVTMAATDPFSHSFSRWSDGVGTPNRLLDLTGSYAALYGQPIAVFAQISGGYGLFGLDFNAYCQYNSTTPLQFGAAAYSVRSNPAPTVLSATITNLDPQNRTITLDGNSTLFFMNTAASNVARWRLTRYITPGLTPGCPNGLTPTPIGAGVAIGPSQSITLYFTSVPAPNLGGQFPGNTAAVFLLLTGSLSTCPVGPPCPYSQNIPFVGTFVIP